MTDIRLNLLVLKTHQLELLRAFYSVLGITFVEEQHGEGPRHFSARVGEVVLELYPLPVDAGPVDDPTRLGFLVSNLDALLERMGASLLREPQQTEWGRRAVVRDPDGRRLELVER